MGTKFPRLGNALGKADFEWVKAESEDVAAALEAEVAAGGEPEDIGRYIARCIGEHRVGTIKRCVSAARYLQAQRETA
jgi:hypothetical protein